MLVVDDQELVRSGFCVILDAADGITVVGEAANGEAAARRCAAHGPDVVLMDIRMPGMDGLEATRLITGDPAAAPKVVMLTTFDLDEYVYEALRAGASGFLLKDVAPARPDRRRPRRRGGRRPARPVGDAPPHRGVRAPAAGNVAVTAAAGLADRPGAGRAPAAGEGPQQRRDRGGACSSARRQ